MKSGFRGVFPGVIIASLFALLYFPPSALGQEHVVSSPELRKDVVAAAQARQNNLTKVQVFLSSDQARKALRSANLSYEKVDKAVSSLNDEELARLAARVDRAQKDFAAGALTNQQITYIIIALATAVLILVLVAIH